MNLTLTLAEVKEFCEFVNRAGWNMGYDEFCKALKGMDVNLQNAYKDTYLKEKWIDFRLLCQVLVKFDPRTLTDILNYCSHKSEGNRSEL